MYSITEVCKKTGLSARTLHHYDAIGLLKPTDVTEAGYRLYDDAAVGRLGQILLFKELDFSLADIARILDDPSIDREAVLDGQIALLNMKKERTERLIRFAKQIKETGVYNMDFTVFDKEKEKKYAEEAKKRWGSTDAYREYEEKCAGDSGDTVNAKAAGLMAIFAAFGKMKDGNAAGKEAQEQVKVLQAYISANYYTCTKEILAGLGQMYAAGGEMTENIDKVGGDGTAVFAARAIEISVECGV